MTSTPPPPPNSPPPPPPLAPNQLEEKAPPAGWLMPLAAALAVVGVFTPWFKPQVTLSGNGQTKTGDAVEDALYSWKEGKLGLIAPIVLVLVAIGVVGVLTGKNSRFHRGSTSPVVNAARGALIAGAVAVVAVLVSYFLLPSQYKFSVPGQGDLSWDDATAFLKRNTGASSVELSQGPQIGFWLTVVAGALSIIAGVLMLVTRSKVTPAGGATPPPAPPQYGGGLPPQPAPGHPGQPGQPGQLGQPGQPGGPVPAPPAGPAAGPDLSKS